MTAHLKYIIFLSVIILFLSAVSIAVLYSTKPSPVELPDTKTEIPIRVAILNGSGREGLAALCARKLRSKGFDVVNGLGENADSFDFDVSVVVDRIGDMGKARYCAEKLGIDEIVEQRVDNPYIIEDVAVVLGRDWNTLYMFKEEDRD